MNDFRYVTSNLTKNTLFESDRMRLERLNSIDEYIESFTREWLYDLHLDENLLYVAKKGIYWYLIEGWDHNCIRGFIKKYGNFNSSLVSKKMRERFTHLPAKYSWKLDNVVFIPEANDDGIVLYDVSILIFTQK